MPEMTLEKWLGLSRDRKIQAIRKAWRENRDTNARLFFRVGRFDHHHDWRADEVALIIDGPSRTYFRNLRCLAVYVELLPYSVLAIEDN